MGSKSGSKSGSKPQIANKNKHVYKLLSGERISIGWLSESDKVWLDQLRVDAENGDDYFILLRSVRGRGARPLRGDSRLTPEIAQSALFRAAEDIVERAGIRQGCSLSPGSELEFPSKKPLVSAPEAAGIIGISRAAIHRALIDGRIRGWRVGAVWVLRRSDVLKYKKNREIDKS